MCRDPRGLVWETAYTDPPGCRRVRTSTFTPRGGTRRSISYPDPRGLVQETACPDPRGLVWETAYSDPLRPVQETACRSLQGVEVGAGAVTPPGSL